MTNERVAPVGYINDARQHALVSVYNPAILNPGSDSVQVVVSIESARVLRDNLDLFLAQHDKMTMFDVVAEACSKVDFSRLRGGIYDLLRYGPSAHRRGKVI